MYICFLYSFLYFICTPSSAFSFLNILCTAILFLGHTLYSMHFMNFHIRVLLKVPEFPSGFLLIIIQFFVEYLNFQFVFGNVTLAILITERVIIISLIFHHFLCHRPSSLPISILLSRLLDRRYLISNTIDALCS